MNEFYTELIYLGRIVLACFCGSVIGIERQNRSKIVGIRTHLMVAMASSLMMIISKYGFMDVVGMEGISCDASRVAAGIISGIGILGGGLILIEKQGMVRGMTTAAGMWVTVGIGMAIGAGMLFIGLTSTIIVVMCQWLLHKDIPILKEAGKGQLDLLISCKENDLFTLEQEMLKYKIKIDRMKYEQKDKKMVHVKLFVTVPKEYGRNDLFKIFNSIEQIYSFEM